MENDCNTAIAAAMPKAVTVLVSHDQMQATVRRSPSATPDACTVESVTLSVAQSGIAITEDVKRRIEEFVERSRSPQFDGEDFVIVQGSLPNDGQDGTVEWVTQAPPATASQSDRFDQELRAAFTYAEKPGPIGKIIPPCPPSDGCDITGTPIPSSNVPRPVELGENVTLASDGVTAVTSQPGKAVFQECKLRIEETQTVAGDVKASAGTIDIQSHLVVKGSVSNGATVRSSQSLLVQGSIEEAMIDVGGDVVVHGGVVTGKTGKVTARGRIIARFCDSARLEAAGNIVFCRECINAQLETRGRLLVEIGAIVGGTIRAEQGIVAASVGCDACTRTDLLIGSMSRLSREQRNIERLNLKRRDSLTSIRKNVGPLMASLKRLSPQQREQATELMFQADTLESDIRESEEKINLAIETYQRLTASCMAGKDIGASVEVHGRIFPGVRMTFDDLTTKFENRLDGPVRVEPRVMKNAKTLVAINIESGQITELATDCIDLDSAQLA